LQIGSQLLELALVQATQLQIVSQLLELALIYEEEPTLILVVID